MASCFGTSDGSCVRWTLYVNANCFLRGGRCMFSEGFFLHTKGVETRVGRKKYCFVNLCEFSFGLAYVSGYWSSAMDEFRNWVFDLIAWKAVAIAFPKHFARDRPLLSYDLMPNANPEERLISMFNSDSINLYYSYLFYLWQNVHIKERKL